ncbi:3-hydroxyacyl-CoA dehydrogenase family protein, partial [Bacillus amyloliquefaciens]|uniref:3-hydroxyacyl-CoA dehydrogenase family protein n=2 Tax=Bacillus TaxID=1386 RepID=UPI0037D28F16
RLKALIYSDDRAGSLLWNMTAPTLVYSAELSGEIADSITAIDQAMKWGFGWSEGPFEMWDSIGVKNAVQKLEAEGWKVADWVKE